ncbi:MAG: superoxide dismutase [Alphaproteobacteria bacterium]|nr:superoxide dismutase [Alphaproteobacteria bacterium]
MSLELPELPFAYDAFAPLMSAETFEYHHDKHHAAYVTNGNKLLEGTDLAHKPIEDIIRATAGNPAQGGIFNNAAQVWNHSFFWHCMKPQGGGTHLPEALQAKIDSDLGGYERFRAAFVDACVTQFGSGWGWLVKDDETGKLEIMKTPNADTPMVHGKTALLTCDVWEHAYYIDYRNARPKYVETFVNEMINWDFVAGNL